MQILREPQQHRGVDSKPDPGALRPPQLEGSSPAAMETFPGLSHSLWLQMAPGTREEDRTGLCRSSLSLPCPSLLQVPQLCPGLFWAPTCQTHCSLRIHAPAVPPSGTPCDPGLQHLGPCCHSILRLNATTQFKLVCLPTSTPLPLGIASSFHFSVGLITFWSSEAYFFAPPRCPALHTGSGWCPAARRDL